MDDGFVKADSTNLPRIDTLMVGIFFALNPDFCSAELRNVKTSMMEWLGSTLLKTLWRPTVNVVRTRYHADKTRLVRRYGYNEKIWSGGLLPRSQGKALPMPEYRPVNPWTERRALFGQNDYIDILGKGDLHPVKTLYTLPAWIRGVQARQEYHVILRKRKMWSKTAKPAMRPTKWKELEKRLSFLYRKLNRKTKTGQSPD